jgi:AraC-like DNA-binding protein
MKGELPTTPHRDDTAAAYQTAVERVIAHMKAHLDEELDLDRLAQIAAISKFHLVRVFDELTGTTPHHFLACLRMQRAKELLFSSDASITEICLEVGYASLGSFSKTFSSLVGVSPQQFRTMPKRLDAKLFARAVWRYLTALQPVPDPVLEGSVEGPARPRGFIFVGTFDRGVPQGIPYSGTVLLRRGRFRIKRPTAAEFHLLAALVPFSASVTALAASLPVELVAGLRLHNPAPAGAARLCLRLRPLRPTDPPIVLAFPAIPELLG